MALDYTNPQVVNEFYRRSLHAGYRKNDIDDFIAQQQQFSAQENAPRAAQQGLITPQQAVQYGGPNVLNTLLEMQETGSLPTTDQVEGQAEDRQTGDILNQLVTRFKQIPGREKGPLSLSTDLDTPWGAIGLPNLVRQDAAEYEQLRRGLAGSIKELVGQSGPLTDQDIALIEGLMPDPEDTPRQAKTAVENMNQFLIIKTGQGLPMETLQLYGIKPSLDQFEE